MKTIFYARVSTAEQTLDHQITQAEKTGFTFDEVVADHGVSGVSTKLADRPQGKRLTDMLRHGDTLVVRWIDRLGRDYSDVTDTMLLLMRRGVIVRTVINNMTFDGSTTDPLQKALRDAMIAVLAAMAESQAETLKAAQKAGIAHAQALGRYRGRKPSYTQEQLEIVTRMVAQGDGVSAIADESGLSRQTIYRIKADPSGAAKILSDWRVV